MSRGKKLGGSSDGGFSSYGLIWVCSSPDFAGQYPLRLKVQNNMDSTATFQFLSLIALVTDMK